MARSAMKAAELPKTTAQGLGALIKSARNIMRKDKGLNGDLDRLPLLTWIMFLKFLDDWFRLRKRTTLRESIVLGEAYFEDWCDKGRSLPIHVLAGYEQGILSIRNLWLGK